MELPLLASQGMTSIPDLDQIYEVECPHCRKQFTGQPATGNAARYVGFKCPHCRLFVPFERARGKATPTGDPPKSTET